MVEDCPDIPYQHLPSYVSFIDVLRCLRTCDNVIGTYNLHGEFNYIYFYMYFLSSIYNIFFLFCCIDVISMVLAISPLEMTRNMGTTRRKLLFSNIQYVFPLV